jgi:hypothetical protein
VTIDYATSDGTATAGSDYVAISGTLIFAVGQTIGTFDVPIIDDSLNEADETVNLTLSNPGNATLDTPSTAILTIVDSYPACPRKPEGDADCDGHITIVDVFVGVAVGCAVLVLVAVGVLVGNGVGVGVYVAVGVFVDAPGWLGVDVNVAVGGTGVDVAGTGVFVAVGVDVGVFVGAGVLVGAGVTVDVLVDVGVLTRGVSSQLEVPVILDAPFNHLIPGANSRFANLGVKILP